MSHIYETADPEQRATGVRVAADALRRGLLAVLPTDTVYGIAADAFTPAAVSALLAAKNRGRDMPVPVLVASRSALQAVAMSLPEPGRALIDAFWPGALSLVLRHTPHLAWDLGDTRGTVMVRMPDHPLALELLRETGPLAVSSANRSGCPPATTCDQAHEQLDERVEVYLDGGPTPAAVPSTIVDLTGDEPRILRVGALAPDRLRRVLPTVRLDGG